MGKKFKSNVDLDWFIASLMRHNGTAINFANTQERKALVFLKNLAEIGMDVAKSKEVIYHCEDGKRLTYSNIGKTMLEIIQNPMIDEIDWIFPNCRLNPFVKVILDVIAASQINVYARRLSLYESIRKTELVAETLNRVVDEIRRKMECVELKKILKNYKRGADKNRKEVSRLVDGLFLRYSKVLVVRVDLSYKKYSPDPLSPHDVDHKDARSDLRNLLKDMREKLFKTDFITYVWKLEYGPIKGYHYHAFFFFNGSKVRQDVNLAKIIGEHWSNVVTKGLGDYFNCNAIKEIYPENGIGMIEHDNLKKIDNLKNKALEYPMKVDYYVRTIADDRIRTFGKGAVPKPKTSNRGRPRQSIEFGLRSPMSYLT